ncbi:MAG: protein kinase [Myxococcales bacterium]|nr:protein kinase [Myxococcales bacterium]
MSSDRPSVPELFDELADLPEAEQRVRLAALRAERPEVVSRLQRLLEADRQALPTQDLAVGEAVADVVSELTAASRPLHPGDVLDETYVALSRVGTGGMAEVWAVRHVRLGTVHAVKVLVRASEALSARLLREGRAQARLQHPNLVPVRGVLDLQGVPALLMPLVTGPTLGQLMREGRLTEGEAFALFRGVVEGVAHAHDHGVIHRDLKPDNVLLEIRDDQLVPRVTDFGLVKELGVAGATQTGMVMGTPAYAAPEQLADASQAGRAADLFSLGVMLVELLTGARPFGGRTLEQIVRAHEGAPQLHGLQPPWSTLAVQLLAVEPAARLPSATVLLERVASVPRATPALLARARALARPVANVPVPTVPHSVGSALHGLPTERDPFFGRETELRDLCERALSGSGRLWTLTGVGGTGKTRLAQRLVRALGKQGWAAWWVDLTEARDEADVRDAVGQRLGVTNADDAKVVEALRGVGQALVVLDNFEQVASHAAATVGAWLDQVDDGVFLVTSRVPLRLRGERVVPVQPLSVAAARELFVARARAVAGDDAVQEADEAVLGRLVELLDCLPLAIELAAARVRHHPPAQLLSMLSRRFRVLRGTDADRHARQRTLQATLDWSWALLSPEEQTALAACAVFEGGFTLSAAEVIVEPLLGEQLVDDVLSSLIDHSLLRLERRRAEPRLSMLVSVQAYAADKLAASEVDVVALLQRHAAYFGGFLRPDGAASAEATQAPVDGVELWNLVAAARRREQHGDDGVAARAVLAASRILVHRGPYGLWRELASDVLHGDVPRPMRVALLHQLALAHKAHEDHEAAVRVADEALALAGEDPGLIHERAEVLLLKGNVLASRLFRQEEGRACMEAAHALVPQASTLMWLAQLSYVQGDRGRARELTLEALALAVQTRDRRQEATGHYFLGYQLRTAGTPREALEALERAEEVAEELAMAPLLGQIGTVQAFCHDLLGESEHAEARATEALQRLTDLGDVRRADGARAALAHILSNMGQLDRAGALFAQLVDSHAAHGRLLEQVRECVNLAGIRSAQGRHDEARALLTEADERSVDVPMPMLRHAVPLYQAWDAVRREQPEEAEVALARCRAVGEGVEVSQRLLRELLESAVLRQRGELEAAEQAVRGMVRGAEAASDARMWSRGELELGRVLEAQERVEEASRAYAAAEERAASAGARRVQAEARRRRTSP